MINPFRSFRWRRHEKSIGGFIGGVFALVAAAYAIVVVLVGSVWFGVELSDDARGRVKSVVEILTTVAVGVFTFSLWRIEASRERIAFLLRQVEGLSLSAPERQLLVWFRIDNTGGRPVSFPAARCHVIVSDPTGRAVRIRAARLQFVATHRSGQAIADEYGCLMVPPGEFRFTLATFSLGGPLLTAKGILELQSTWGRTEEGKFKAGTT